MEVKDFAGFCHCGHYTVLIRGEEWCKKHKFEVKKETKIPIKKYSGQSKTPYGGYDEK